MGHCATWKLPPYPGGGRDEYPEWWAEADRWQRARNTCSECGSTKLETRNYNIIWKDGDVYCENGHYVRGYDAG